MSLKGLSVFVKLNGLRTPTFLKEKDKLVLISCLISVCTWNRKYKILDIFYFGQIKILRQFLWELHWCYIENREKQELVCWRNFDFEKFLFLKRKMSYYSAKLMDNLVIQFVLVFLSVGHNLVFLLKARSKTNKVWDKWRCFG